MGCRGRFVVICTVTLFFAAGSSARQASSDDGRVPPTEPRILVAPTAAIPERLEPAAAILERLEPAPAGEADIRHEKMLAWIILMMKSGRGAR